MKRNRTRTYLEAAAALCGVAALAACAHLLPRPTTHYDFSHKLHAKKLEIACLKCHAGVEASVDVKRRHSPTQKVCAECHEQEVGGRNCGRCHTNPEVLARARSREGLPRPDTMSHLKFAHASHMSRVDNDCTVCHEAILASTKPRGGALPDMDVCMQCHQDMYDRLQCNQCHVDLGDPKYQPKLVRFVHRGNWLRNHHLQAEQQGYATCQQCHLESFCSDCHSAVDNKIKMSGKWPRRVDRQFIHRGDWIDRHPVRARLDSQACLACHRINTCNDCHRRSGLQVVKSGLSILGGHPIVRVAAGGHDTSPAALSKIRLNIVECAGCHESRQPICLNCHSDDTLAINPHPPGFDPQLSRTKRAVCRKCHRS
ncbi:MAG: hypothetical protein D6739_11645 [Nitrospirae bacterium]|nr:MAG: hypothetical protein D6739_11645 [Nitrospirota bacterium]